MPRKSKWLLSAILLWSLSSCAPKPPDVPACEHMAQRFETDPVTGHLILSPSPTCMRAIDEPECGHCVYIVSGRELFLGENEKHRLNGKPWSVIRSQAVYLPAEESYAPLAAYIINACKKMGCSDEVSRFKIKLDFLDKVQKAGVQNP